MDEIRGAADVAGVVVTFAKSTGQSSTEIGKLICFDFFVMNATMLTMVMQMNPDTIPTSAPAAFVKGKNNAMRNTPYREPAVAPITANVAL